ncbi:MAG TPA: hypothetical protein VK631_07015 [Solirubrobacteraceae bacterium]|nr:hypothetical protein [Solirubrobacteraceae bacterium]
MTQTDRVLAALSRAGARGITAVDFAAPDVCDGGKPIMRVAARVKDLRDAGFEIETGGERDSCAVYKLQAHRGEQVTSEAQARVAVIKGAPGLEAAVPPESSGTLFDAPAAPAPRFWEDAA